MNFMHARRAGASAVTLMALVTIPLPLASPAWAQAAITGPTAAQQTTAASRMNAAYALLQKKSWGAAIAAFTDLVNIDTPEIRGQARYGLALALDQTGKPDQALKALDGTLMDDSPLGRAVGILRAQLTLQAAELALNENNALVAQQWLDTYDRLAAQPDKARAIRLRAALEPPSGMRTLTLKVGVLVPQSGTMHDVGHAVLRGLQLGLQDFDGRRGTRLELWPMDATTPEDTSRAAQTLAEKGVDVVVGPILAPNVEAAAAVLRPKSIPLLVLTSDRSVLGPYVHTLNYLPAAQATLAAQAALGNGKTRLAALIPQGTYGEEALAGLQNAVGQGGGTVVRSVVYNPQTTDLGPSIRDLVGQGIDFDALLAPAPGRFLAMLTAQLAYHDLDKAHVQLLGTALWQDPAVLTPGSGMLQGALFAAPTRADVFTGHFLQTYGQNPHPLSVMAYDAARILADLAGEKQRTGNAVNQLLLRPEGFYGSGGYLRFTERGTTERGLDLVRIVRDDAGGGTVFQVERNGLALAPLNLPADIKPSAQPVRWW